MGWHGAGRRVYSRAETWAAHASPAARSSRKHTSRQHCGTGMASATKYALRALGTI